MESIPKKTESKGRKIEKMEKNYIFERVFVETPVDTDKDGKLDLIAVYIKRPLSTLNGNKVPAIYVANPYMLTCNEDWYVPHDVNKEVKVYPEQSISFDDVKYDFSEDRTSKPEIVRETKGFAETAEVPEDQTFECISDLYDHFLERDYAAVFCGGLGTRGSEGITITGSREEILAFKSVIDWLNGRCRAFTDKEGNIEIKANWCTGNVAMSAKSYLGTMCIGVAATGVEGLKTVIPEAAISNWYAYYKCNGLNLPAIGWQGDDLDILAKYCFSRAKDADDFAKVKEVFEASQAKLVEGEDRESGNYNRFWDERNYLNQLDNVKASFFIIHGINDWNVKTNQCAPLFEELEKRDIPRKMMLHQGEHIYIYHLEESETLPILERWLDFYLKGIDTGIENEPKLLVESNIDQTVWQASDVWPPFEERHIFPVNETGEAVFTDDISKTAYDKEKDNLKDWLDELVLSEDAAYTNRLKYVWDPAEDGAKGDMRFAGYGKVSFDAAIDRPTAILSAMLVDIGEDCRITAEEVKDDNGNFRFGLEKEPSKYKVITRGWLNAQNRSTSYSKEKIEEGKFYNYKFDMVPTDYTVREGHKLALIIYGIDAEATQRPDTVTTVTVKQDSIKVECPLCLNL